MLIWKRNTFVIWICIRSRGSESSLASWTRCLCGKLRNETKRTKQTRATEGTHVGSFGSSRSTHGHIDIERGLKRLERSCMCETQGQLQVSPYCLLCWWTWRQHKCRFHIFWYWRNYVRVWKTVQWNCKSNTNPNIMQNHLPGMHKYICFSLGVCHSASSTAGRFMRVGEHFGFAQMQSERFREAEQILDSTTAPLAKKVWHSADRDENQSSSTGSTQCHHAE